MKKSIIVLSLFTIMIINTFSQDASDKIFRFGLRIAPTFNWMKPDNQKLFENNGISLGFVWGANGEYKFGDLFSVCAAIEVSHERGKIKFLNSSNYYINQNYEFLTPTKDGVTGLYTDYKSEGNEVFIVNTAERKYKSTYIDIPLTAKMKTNEIGYLTYFGEFGINLGVRAKTRISEDKSTNSNLNLLSKTTTLDNLNDINYNNDMQLLRTQLRIGFGAEYNLSGATSLVGAIYYNHGFSNAVRKESKYMITNDMKALLTQKFLQSSFNITIGVLF